MNSYQQKGASLHEFILSLAITKVITNHEPKDITDLEKMYMHLM